MKANGNASLGAAASAVSPTEAVLPTSGLSNRLQLLHRLRFHLEAKIAADRRYWGVLLRRLLSIYQEIEDCSVAQALAPHQAQAPQRPEPRRKRDDAPQRAAAKAA